MGFITCILFAFVVPIMGQTMYSKMISFNNGNYNVSWIFNASTDALQFLVKVRATGWVGFGFALNAPNNMTDYDVAVGGVLNNGTSYLQDYFTQGRVTPTPEQQQDFMLLNATEDNGVTSLTISRKRNTSDLQDVVIQQGMPLFVIWAYHSSSDVQPSSFSRHTARGFQQEILIPTMTLSPTPATATTVTAATPVMEVRPMHFANFRSFDNTNYNVSWMFNKTTDSLHFMVEVRATGWIGFGVATRAPNSMNGYDVAVGGVLAGMGYLQDYLTIGRMRPQLDSQQDWTLSYSREENGVTTLRFYRKRDTGDAVNDTVIQQGTPLFVIWAYHSSNDVQLSSFLEHTARGFQQEILIPAMPTLSPTPATPVITATPVMEVRPMHFANFRSFDSNNYNVSWMFNKTTDSLHFMVEVRATGWIGFGVATRAPNSMNGYDVAVGGVLAGMGYLQDYLTIGRMRPQLDSQQDWTLSYSREENGVTTLRFYRKRDTGDAVNDTVIQQGTPLSVIWAYHSSNDVQLSSFLEHTARGFQQEILIPAMPTLSPTPATPVITATPVMEVRPMHFANFRSFDSNNYNVSWMFNKTTDSLHFMVEVRATGWIGFGVATRAPNSMNGYDVAVGGVLAGMGYLQDYLTIGRMRPQLDSQQDWTLSYSREENGVTTLRFYRKRDTGDAVNDTVIQQGTPLSVIWAYHSSNDVQLSSFLEHTARGFQQEILIPAMPTLSPTPATPVITATPVMEVRPMHFANFRSFDSNNYNVSWMFNKTTDSLHFMVEVRATGWIGFGVATRAPNSMNGYDVAVGGVLAGMGYLQDYLTIGRMRPQLDSQQDWTLSYSREENGVTTLRFYRKRDTGDAVNDTVIQQGTPLSVIWAYHSSNDVQLSSFLEHTARGFQQEILIPAMPTLSPTPATPVITATPVMEVRPMHFANFRSFDSNNYNVSWMFNKTTDSLHFMVEVRATGWIGFGVATRAPNSMNGYDVAVGGVLAGMGYLQDYLTIGRMRPQLDSQQDWTLSYSREENGVTTLRFYRKRDTGDAVNDTVIQQGTPLSVIWAYHSSNDVQLSSFLEHTARGFQQEILIPAMPTLSPTPAPTTGPTQGGGAGQGGEIDNGNEKANETRATITILLAVSLGLIVVCLILISMGLAYFTRVMKAAS